MVRAAAVAAAWLLTVGAAAPEPSFQGYHLGMTVGEVKAVPIPATRQGAAEIRCVGEAGAPTTLAALPGEVAAGVLACAPAVDIDGTPYLASLYLAPDVQVQTRFSFLDGKLYRIAGTLPAANRDAVVGALTERYGEPAIRDRRDVQNAFGARYAQELLSWTFPGARIDVTAPAGSLRAMSLTYLAPATAETARSRIAEAEKAQLRL
jgi:hypothetical protein